MGIRTDGNTAPVLNLPRFYESRFVSNEIIEAAQGNPQLWDIAKDAMSNPFGSQENMAYAWAEMSQVMVGRFAPISGIDASIFETVVGNVSNFAYLKTPKDIILGLVDTTLGIVVDALSAVPIVGQIVAALDSVIRTLIDVFGKDKDKPPPEVLLPMQSYSTGVDEALVQDALDALSTYSWTRLFMPAFRVTDVAGNSTWTVEKREGGWAVFPKMDTDGMGFIPGSQRCTSVINIWFTAMSERDNRKNNPFALPVNYAASGDTGDFYPGLSSLLTSVGGQIERAQTQMWNVDVNKVRLAWDDYAYSAVRFAADIYSGRYREGGLSSLTTEQREVFARAFLRQLKVKDGMKGHSMTTTGWFPASLRYNEEATIFQEIVEPWAKRVRRRQVHNLGTLAMPTCAAESDAIVNDQSMATLLAMTRQLFLTARYRDEVFKINPNNVTDPDYRELVREARGPAHLIPPRFTAAPAKASTVWRPDNPDGAPAEKPTGGVPLEGDAGTLAAAPLFAVAGLAAIGLLMRRR